MSNVIYKADNFFIRHISKSDVYGNWWKWFNDTEVTLFMNKGISKNTIKKQLSFYEKINKSENDIIFAICDLSSSKHIGTIGLHKIDKKNKTAQFGIVIGEKSFWGKGIGSLSWQAVIDYGFKNIKLKNINTTIFDLNKSSMRIAEKIGFEKIKFLKNDIIKDNKSYDRIYLELKAEKWENLKIIK